MCLCCCDTLTWIWCWIAVLCFTADFGLTSANNMTARGRTLSSSDVRGGPSVSICKWRIVCRQLAQEATDACCGGCDRMSGHSPVAMPTCCPAAARQQLHAHCFAALPRCLLAPCTHLRLLSVDPTLRRWSAARVTFQSYRNGSWRRSNVDVVQYNRSHLTILIITWKFPSMDCERSCEAVLGDSCIAWQGIVDLASDQHLHTSTS